MVISSVISERWAFAPYGIILHFIRVRSGEKRVWGEVGFPGELLTAPFQPPRSTIFRTGRLLAPSMPVSSSALPALPPQPS